MNRTSSARRSTRGKQDGVVLIIALIMLVVVSMLATLSIRNATSSEAVSGAVRTTQLASQAAETALRICEDTLFDIQRNGGAAPAGWGGPLAYVKDAPPHYTVMSTWDTASADVYVIPMTSVNTGTATFRRAPECMVENVRISSNDAAAGNFSTTKTFVITARGFGPEVSADASRSRPDGTEVWLQSTVELN